MDTNERAQTRLILENIGDLARHDFEQKLKAIYADHSARGLLQSGATIRVAVRAMEELGGRMISDCVDQASAVAKDIEAFAMISEVVQSFLSFLQDKVEPIATMVGGRVVQQGKGASILNAARNLFIEARTRLDRQLEIHRFTFMQPSKGTLAEQAARLGLTPSVGQSGPGRKNVGGKPLAAHWDEMWADISVQLWNGDLKPTKQKHISDAMFAWFTAREIDIGQTAVTERARALWLKLEAKPDS